MNKLLLTLCYITCTYPVNGIVFGMDNFDCDLYYWSHEHNFKNTCVIKNLDMKNLDKKSKFYAYFRVEIDNSKASALMINSTVNTLIPNFLHELSNLKAFRVHKTDLTKISQIVEKEASNIEYLNFGHNQVSVIAPNAFTNLPKLRFLYLNDNSLSVISDTTFDSLESVQVIWLNNNKLREISDKLFSQNLKLNRLKLQYNQITFIEDKAFEKATSAVGNLKKLDLRGNLCIDKETFLYNISKLVELTRSVCIKKLDLVIDNF